MKGFCSWKELNDGTYDLHDVYLMNEAISLQVEAEYLATREE